jgi:transcriptional regulator with XRE-family HTH domain
MTAKRPLPELKAYRKRQRPPLSVTALAEKMGVSPAAVSRWESGKRRPDKKFVPTLAKMTGVPALELMGVAK